MKIREGGPGYLYYCPGCETAHGINDTWEFDQNFDEPTIYPSVLAQGTIQCHAFVTKGYINFLSDSEHSLAGQTVPMPELPDWLA